MFVRRMPSLLSASWSLFGGLLRRTMAIPRTSTCTGEAFLPCMPLAQFGGTAQGLRSTTFCGDQLRSSCPDIFYYSLHVLFRCRHFYVVQKSKKALLARALLRSLAGKNEKRHKLDLLLFARQALHLYRCRHCCRRCQTCIFVLDQQWHRKVKDRYLLPSPLKLPN